jgi:hypothetical protein
MFYLGVSGIPHLPPKMGLRHLKSCACNANDHHPCHVPNRIMYTFTKRDNETFEPFKTWSNGPTSPNIALATKTTSGCHPRLPKF